MIETGEISAANSNTCCGIDSGLRLLRLPCIEREASELLSIALCGVSE